MISYKFIINFILNGAIVIIIRFTKLKNKVEVRYKIFFLHLNHYYMYAYYLKFLLILDVVVINFLK